MPKTVLRILACLIAIVIGCLLAGTPAFADDEDFAELMARSKAIRAEITAAQDEYLIAVQQASEIETQKEAAETRLAEIQDDLAAARAKLGTVAVAAYKSNNGAEYLALILDAENFAEAIAGMQYLESLAAERQRTVDEIAALEAEAAELPEKLSEQKALAEELAEAAGSAESSFKSKLAAVKKEMQPYLAEHADKVASKSGSAQLEEIIDYIENVEEGTEEQVAIIRSAYAMTGVGGYNGLCEGFVEAILRNAGINMPRYISAWEDCKANLYSTDMSEIKAGCLVFASGSGSEGSAFGHTGICVYANGNPDDIRICDSVSSSGTSQTLSEWLSWQTAVNYETGESGLFGWGYPPGYYW